MKMIDISGNRYGRLLVVGYAGIIRSKKSGHTATLWNCKCDCGNELTVPRYRLTSGNTRSCGCLKVDTNARRCTTHGKSKSKLYSVWGSMKDRCYRESDKGYVNYGGRGIRVCDQWRNSFDEFRKWAIESGYKDGLTIERNDVNGNYCPENCCWIPKAEQSKNRRNCHYITYHGETKTLSEWSRELHVDRQCVRNKENELGSGELAIDAILNSPRHKEKVEGV